MNVNFKTSFHKIERVFISSLMIFVWLYFRNVNSSNSFNVVSLGKTAAFNLSPNKQNSNVNVTFLGVEIIYDVYRKYDFFVPDVDVACQCTCDDEAETSCHLDDACSRLSNSTTSCTIHNTAASGLSTCRKSYKLCCQVYFTKTNLMNPFKALYLKYQRTVLKFSIRSKSFGNKLNSYNVTFTENVNTSVLSPDKVLHISEVFPVPPIPESWYFIEEGSNELKHSEFINSIDEQNMNKIGWFHYNVQQKRLTRVSARDLKQRLQVNLLDCQSNPPKVEWKLNATYYVRKGLLHFPENIQKVFEMNTDISKISVKNEEKQMRMEIHSFSSVNVTLTTSASHSFIFTSSIKETVLNLTFTKGSGSFHVKITSSRWPEVIIFSTKHTENIIELSPLNYDSCWMCVSQNKEQLCQMPSVIKRQDIPITSFTVGIHNNSFNESDFGRTSFVSVNEFKTVVVIVASLFSAFILVTSLLVIATCLRKQQKLSKRRNAICEAELEPLSFNGRNTHSTSFIMKYFHRKTSLNRPQNCENSELKRQYKGIQLRIEENQISAYREVELPQVIWTDRILPLEELYVNLQLLNTFGDCEEIKGEPMQLEELFIQTDQEEPVRILIEGDPGYGKTTLCCKLLNDWGRNRSYLRSKFKMVFLFQLRYFKENYSLEEMLKSEYQEIGVNDDDVINCIEAFENETLLILDGFDELNDEGKRKILPLIQKKKYPSMYVMVTSRRGVIGIGEEKGIRERRIVKKTLEDVKVKHLWNKRILIKGVTRDQIETFMAKYFHKTFQDLEFKITNMIRGGMVEVFECPLFLILLAMILEEKKLENIKSKLSLYKEFFNFIIRRNLIREKNISDEEEVDIFGDSSDHSELIQAVDEFGRLAIEYLCVNKLLFDEKEILEYCKDKMIFHLGFLTKIPKIQGRRKENFYQPIHKSFLEFVAAFAMWNLFQRDENQFKIEIERIANKGLKPSNDSLFYVFLGGFMNDKANVLFQYLTRYASWFNIESICFTNILLEIKSIHSFFPSFQPILDKYIPSLYRLNSFQGLTEDYFQSEIHSLILKHSSDRQLISVLWWNCQFSLNYSHELIVESFYLHLTDEVFQTCSNENKTSIKCKNIICEFSENIEIVKWNKFVSLLNSIQNEKVHFFFGSKSNKINSHLLYLLYKELMEGQWKQKKIDRLRFYLNESDDPLSLSLLVDLIKRNRIIEGIHLAIRESKRRTDEENSFLKKQAEELFKAIIQSKTIREFSVVNIDSHISPEFDFNQIINPQLNSFYFDGSLKFFNSTQKRKHSVEVVTLYSFDDALQLNFIQNFRDIKYLECNTICFNSLVEMEWPILKGIEELELDIPDPEQLHLLISISQLTKLQVLTLDVANIKTIPSQCQLLFINLFSSLNLRICQFIFIQNLELFSYFTETLMEGLNKKEMDEHDSTIVTNEEKTVQLQELVIIFGQIQMNYYEFKECNGIRWIQSMLQNQQLRQCCWVDFYNYNLIKSDQLEESFPSSDKFRISCEVNGMSPNSSRWSQNLYHWLIIREKLCIKFVDK